MEGVQRKMGDAFRCSQRNFSLKLVFPWCVHKCTLRVHLPNFYFFSRHWLMGVSIWTINKARTLEFDWALCDEHY